MIGVAQPDRMNRIGAIVPTVFRSGRYRFFLYAGDGGEPRHVHVERDSSEAKYWLHPEQLERSRGFAARELRDVLFLIESNLQLLSEGWDNFFGD